MASTLGKAGACVGRLRERGTKRKNRCFYDGVGDCPHPSCAPESLARLPHSEFPRPIMYAMSSQEHALGTHSHLVCCRRTGANLKGGGIVNRLRVNIKQKVIEIWGEDLGS